MGYDGDIPANYDKFLGPTLFVPYAHEAACRIIIKKPRDVLEIASGSGAGTRTLRSRLPTASRLTATDISADMLRVARSKFTDDEKVTFEIVNACDLPYPDGSYDAVVGQFGYMFYPDKLKAMSEAFRVLKPGGSYLLTVWDSGQHNPWGPICLDILKSFFPDNPPLWLNEPMSCAAIDPVKENLISAGFDDVVVSILNKSREFNPDEFAHGIIFGSPVINEIEERGGVAAEEIRTVYARTLRHELGQTLKTQAIMYEAVRRV